MPIQASISHHFHSAPWGGRERTFYGLAVPRRRNFTHRLRDLPILIAHAHKAHRNLSSRPRGAQRVRTTARHGTLHRGTNDDRLSADRSKAVDVCAQVYLHNITLDKLLCRQWVRAACMGWWLPGRWRGGEMTRKGRIGGVGLLISTTRFGAGGERGGDEI